MGQAFLIGPDHATTAAALEALVPADIANLKPGQQRYSQLLNDDGGIIDDLMVTRSALRGRRRQPDAGGQCVAQGGGLRPHRRRGCPTTCASSRRRSARCSPAGAGRQGRDGEAVATLRRACRSCGAPSGKVGELRLPHLALGLHRRGRLRDFGRRRQGGGAGAAAAGAGGRAADRPRRARLAAAGGGPVPLRPRHRRDHEPDRGRPRLVDPEAPPRARADFPAPSASRTSWPTGPSGAASASSRTAARRRARARRFSPCWATSSASSPRAASGRASTARWPWATSKAGYAEPGTPVNLMVRGKALSGVGRAAAVRCRIATRAKS